MKTVRAGLLNRSCREICNPLLLTTSYLPSDLHVCINDCYELILNNTDKKL